MQPTNLSGLFTWAHESARVTMAQGGRMAVGGPVLSYQACFAACVRIAWRSETFIRRFGLWSAKDRRIARDAKADAARRQAEWLAYESADKAAIAARAAILSDAQLRSEHAAAWASHHDAARRDWTEEAAASRKLRVLSAEAARRPAMQEAA